MKMNKALLIDPELFCVKTVTVRNHIKDIYKVIEAEVFASVNLDDKNTLYVDDEALINGKVDSCNAFSVETEYGQTHPIIGKALVLGFDAESGDSTNTTLNENLIDKIQWYPNGVMERVSYV